MKKFIKTLCLISALCLLFSNSIYAKDVPSNESVVVITMTDENGNETEYKVAEGEPVTVPVYITKKGNTKSISVLGATLRFYNLVGQVSFVFTPQPEFIYKTFGFSGEFTSYNGGNRWGYNTYVNALKGLVSAPSSGQCSLAGSYSVLGYNPTTITKAWRW